MKPGHLDARTGRCAAIVWIALLGSAGLDGQSLVRLAEDSPLAANDNAVFAVADDGRTLVSRPLGERVPWTPVSLTPAPKSIGGLAASRGALFIADTEGAALFRLTLPEGAAPPGGGAVAVLHQGAPLRRPRELALAGLLLVADDETHDVHAISPDGGTLAQVRGLSKLSEQPIHMTGSEFPAEGHVLVSLGGAAPQIFEARLAGPEVIFRRRLLAQSPSRRASDAPERPSVGLPRRPGAVALRAGVVYVADEEDGALFAFPRESGRPVRIVRARPSGQHEERTARVAVTEDHLLELDPAARDVVQRPRLVPAELVLQTESLSETLSLWYTYLHRNGLLPTRQVPHERNIETTLRAQEALLAPWVDRLTPLMCALNAPYCARGVLRPLKDGDPVRIPDLPFERFVDVRRIDLDGGRTLGQRVDQLVSSEEFASWRTEETLRKLNPPDAGKPSVFSQVVLPAEQPLRPRRSGSYVVPGEAVRYLAAVRVADMPPARSELQRLARYEGARIRSLEERRTAAAAGGGHPQPPQSQLEALRKAFADATAGWSADLWIPRPVLIRPHVALVEEFINRDNPVFVEGGDDAFALDRPATPEPASIVPVSAAGGLVLRDADKADHGTGVAWLIGGRRSAFGAAGLAPSALLFGLSNNLGTFLDALPDAVAQHNVHIVNISAYWDDKKPVAGLSETIDLFEDSVLFVAAAGNNATTTTDGEVCRALQAFPVCWGDRKNVLVVTATNHDGTGLLPPVTDATGKVTFKGANWSAKAVHVAARGEGFHVPGANEAYVPARGSSFATPLVTATAALLYSQGVQRPSLIKDRILATADPVAGPARFVKAGVLNVRRALGHPFATVVQQTRDGEGLPVVVIPGQKIQITTRTGDQLTISLDHVRRLHKHGTQGRWRIVYAGGQNHDTLEFVEDVQFTDEAHSGFRFFPLVEVASAGPEPRRYWVVARTDLATERKLVDFWDFIGPAVPAGR